MNPDVALCPHLASPAEAGAALALAPDDILGWYDGPVEAIVRCRRCAACGWLELVDWSRSRGVRVFALAGLRAADAALYQRNAKKGSCDPARERTEREALAAAAGPFERLVAWDVRAERVLAVAPAPPGQAVPPGEWRERLPAEGDVRWFAPLGVDKAEGSA